MSQKVQTAATSAAKTATPQMDTELKQEFQSFKAGKLIKKLAMLRISYPYSMEVVKNAVAQTRAGNLDGIGVLPTAVSQAAKLMAGANPTVCAVISYPHGEDVLKSKIVAAKTALSNNAEELIVFGSASPLKRGDVKAIRKEADKLKGLGKRAGFRYALILDGLNETEKEKLFRAFKTYPCPIVLVRNGSSVTAADVAQAKTFAVGCAVEAMGNYRTHTEALTVLEAGAQRLWSPFADELSKGFLQEFETSVSQAK